MSGIKRFDTSRLKTRHNIADDEVAMFKKIFIRIPPIPLVKHPHVK